MRGKAIVAATRGVFGGPCYPNARAAETLMAKIRNPKDFAAGLMFVAFGVAAIAIGSGYPLGVAARMGPGYFPRILGIMLIVASSAASTEFRWKEALVSGVVLAALSVAGFIWGLGLQFSVWPTFLGRG